MAETSTNTMLQILPLRKNSSYATLYPRSYGWARLQLFQLFGNIELPILKKCDKLLNNYI